MKVSNTVLGASIAILVIGIGLYLTLRQPETWPPPAHIETSGRDRETSSTALGSVDSLLTGLEAKLATDPSDAKGWLLLAKSYSHLGRTDDAAIAYAKAEALGEADPNFAALLDGATAMGDASAATSPVIRGRLTIADGATRGLEPTDTVFIFAKSIDGSAMPVAVLRKAVGDLPFAFELTDQHAMSAAANLSGTTSVTITARVSKSGNAMQAEPGLEVVSQPMRVREAGLVELELGNPASAEES